MRTRLCVTTAVIAVAGASGSAGAAVTDGQKCLLAKLAASGKYAACRLKAERKAVRKSLPPAYTACDAKLQLAWTKAEAKYGVACPSSGDLAALQDFVSLHTDDVATALGGGVFPDCPGDLTTCGGSLSTCSDGLASCDASLLTCNGSLGTCAANDASCAATLTTVDAGSATPAEVLSGQTFSSGAGLGIAGTLPNVGQQNVIPGTAPVAIAAGYHDGSGTVAGGADLVAANIKDGVAIFGVTGIRLNPPLQTGQTAAYGAGSDGDLQTGAARSFTDNGDGTITDNATGLMWEKKSDDGSIHDKDDQYGYASLSTTFLTALNAGGGFAGYTDWRIPNFEELMGIMKYKNSTPTVAAVFDSGCTASCTVTSCSCTRPAPYWSSTQHDAQSALTVGFDGGQSPIDYKTELKAVRAVRGGF